MGNCCTGSPTIEHPLETGARSANSLLQQQGYPSFVGGASPGGHLASAIPEPATPEPQQLEHIADREDLTNNEGTMFLEKSKHAMKMMRARSRSHSDRRRHSSARLSHATSSSSSATRSSPITIQKANSCSTIYTDDSTVSLPNLKSTLKCVSLAVFYHIKNRDRDREPRTLPIFDEKLHPLSRDEVPPYYADYTPDHKVIYKFVKTLFHAAQLTAECAIITMIYLERILHYSELDLHPCNWKRILLGAILLASKVWDDQAVWNVDYCQILRDITVEDMNELERVYLEQLQFNINVPSSQYAQYYFDLRSLAEDNGLMFPSEYEPLTKERARKLELISRTTEERLFNPSTLKKSASSEPLSSRNVAILM